MYCIFTGKQRALYKNKVHKEHIELHRTTQRTPISQRTHPTLMDTLLTLNTLDCNAGYPVPNTTTVDVHEQTFLQNSQNRPKLI